jgi:hypothetical protein
VSDICRGGFGYNLNSVAFGQYADGSTAGWAVLALLDSEAAGATIPAWVRSEVQTYYLPAAQNSDGSWKYQVYEPDNASNFPKTGIGLQVQHFVNIGGGDPKVLQAESLLGSTWSGGFSSDGFVGFNKGHSYSMFNAFKGLKLYGVTSLAGVGRPAGPGSIPADDWYADYQDFLVATQDSPTSPLGGDWNQQWSYCGGCDLGGGLVGGTAVAELILSPVALVLPAHLTLSPATATNPVGTSHTVTAVATSNINTPVAGATVTFTVTSGPNAGTTGPGVTDATGTATFTYTDTGGAGTDQIQANIGTILSNSVQKIWISPNQPPVCTNATPSVSLLWPPNHQWVPITINGVTDPNGDPITITITQIAQDEPINGLGDGDTAPDGSGIGTSTANVRAERAGTPKVPGDGRVYHISFSASDGNGGTCTGAVTVGVPHDQSPQRRNPVDGGSLFNSVTGAPLP